MKYKDKRNMPETNHFHFHSQPTQRDFRKIKGDFTYCK